MPLTSKALVGDKAQAGPEKNENSQTKKIQDALKWQAEENKGKWPVIVKPALGAGTAGVHWCLNEADVKEAFKVELPEEAHEGLYRGTQEEALLVQE